MGKIVLMKIKKVLIFVGEKLLFVQTTIILTVVYFFMLGPTAIFSMLLGRDFLHSKSTSRTFWQDRKKLDISLKQAEKQF